MQNTNDVFFLDFRHHADRSSVQALCPVGPEDLGNRREAEEIAENLFSSVQFLTLTLAEGVPWKGP